MKNAKMRLFQNFSFGTATLNDAILQGVSLKNCKTCPKTNRVFGQVQLFMAVLPALALVCGMMALAACGGGGGGSGGGLSKSEARDMEKLDKALLEGDIDGAVAIAKKMDSKQKNIAQPTDFSYGLTKDEKGIVITKYDGAGGVVVVPSVIEDYPVVEIRDRVFMGKFNNNYYPANEITELVLPNTVTSLGEKLCIENENLAKVTLPAGLKVIPRHAFLMCPNLTEVHLPKSVEIIGSWAFKNCENLITVNLPASLKEIEGAFSGCGNLFNLSIPDSLTAVEFTSDYTFFGCGKLPIKTRQRLKALGYQGIF